MLTYSIGLLLSKGFMGGIKKMIMSDKHLVDKVWHVTCVMHHAC